MSMTKLETVKYIMELPLEKKGWLAIFVVGSILSWFAIRMMPMRKLSSFMGHHLNNRTLCIPVDKQDRLKAISMGRLMSMVGNNTPWECKCLSEALCVKWLLDRYDIPSVFYLGATITDTIESGMKAHAWIDVGSKTVIGKYERINYRVAATFSSIKFTE